MDTDLEAGDEDESMMEWSCGVASAGWRGNTLVLFGRPVKERLASNKRIANRATGKWQQDGHTVLFLVTRGRAKGGNGSTRKIRKRREIWWSGNLLPVDV